jgi:low affinity Fe/Cu permease
VNLDGVCSLFQFLAQRLEVISHYMLLSWHAAAWFGTSAHMFVTVGQAKVCTQTQPPLLQFNRRMFLIYALLARVEP